jgi:hypothetical protein
VAALQVNLHAMTAGVAMLSLYSWLLGMKRRLLGAGRGYLPLQLAIVTDKGKGAKEQGNLVVKEAVSAMLAGWRAPFRHALHFRPLDHCHTSIRMLARPLKGADVVPYLLSSI